MSAIRLSLRVADEDDVARRDGLHEALDGGTIEIDEEFLRIAMGSPAIFSAAIPRSSIRSVECRPDLSGPTTGVHGFRGRWLVNRSSKGIVQLRMRPRATAHLALPSPSEADLTGIGRFIVRWITRERSIRLRELTLSVEQPDALVEALTA